MTPEEIIIGNKLIAEFMGYIESSSDGDFTFFEHPDGKGIVTQSEFDHTKYISHGLMEVRGFIFHRSWDWLIPVIDKIYDNDEYYGYSDNSIFGWILTINTKYIEATWEQVVEFIIYYNKQKSKLKP